MKLKPFCPNYHILTSSIVLTLNLASLSFKRSCFNGNPKDKTGQFWQFISLFYCNFFSIFTEPRLPSPCNILYFSSHRTMSTIIALLPLKSANFKMSYWFHRFDQKPNEFFLRILALEVKSKK